MSPKRKPNKNALRELMRYIDTLALKTKIINCKNCHVEVRKISGGFVVLLQTEDGLCEEHQKELDNLNREYAESGWW